MKVCLEIWELGVLVHLRWHWTRLMRWSRQWTAMGMEGSATVSSGDKKSVKMRTYSFIFPFFFTPVPLIVGRWYIHQITRKWCFGSQGGLDKSSFGTFNLRHANLKKCLKPIKLKKNHNIYQGWWWAPSRWSSRRTRWWRWRLLRRPTNGCFKKTAQTRATH